MEPPVAYFSVRFTVAHARLQEVIDFVSTDVEWYIIYPHFGKNGDNEHFHVLLPAVDKAGRQRFNRAASSRFGAGQSFFRTKRMQNGLTQAITYCARERTEPTAFGPHVGEWIAAAPEWLPHGQQSRKRKRRQFLNEEDEWVDMPTLVNKYNIDAVAANYYKRHAQRLGAPPSWRATIRALLAEPKYTFFFEDGKIDPLHELVFLNAVGAEGAFANLEHRLLGFDFSTLE